MIALTLKISCLIHLAMVEREAGFPLKEPVGRTKKNSVLQIESEAARQHPDSVRNFFFFFLNRTGGGQDYILIEVEKERPL